MSINEYSANGYQQKKYCSANELSKINEYSDNEYSKQTAMSAQHVQGNSFQLQNVAI